MVGTIKLQRSSGGNSKPIELNKGSSYLLKRDGKYALSQSEAAAESAILELCWNRRLCTWMATKLSSQAIASKNGEALSPQPTRLSNNDMINVNNEVQIHFERISNAPLWNGVDANKLDLAGVSELIIGRSNPEKDQGLSKLCLDQDNFLISSNHAKLSKENGQWFIEDLGKIGTELNGKLIINKDSLVFGDRFAVADYLFEFTGKSLVRIDHLDEGSINVENISVTVKDRLTGKPKRILNDVSTQIQQGEFIGILGGSGQGKSTFLDALCGMRPASEGTVTIGGVSNLVLAQKYPGTIGYVPQDDIVHQELSVYAAFWYSGKLRLKLESKELKTLIDRTLETLGLTEHRKKIISTLSGGQRKRVSIGIELLSKPSILFLDEPSSGLDPATEQSLMELLQSLSLNKLTVVCTTHVLQNAFIFNRLFFIHSGRLIFTGSTNEAREFFNERDHSVSATKTVMTSPLERIYSTVLNGTKTAEDWLAKYNERNAHKIKLLPDNQSSPTKKKSPSTPLKLLTLLKRQWTIMRADWLNIAFLFAQVIIIGLLTAWSSDDLGFRTFIGLIAAMWFGCSNGAQQIVGEMPIYQRERVCGLGINCYVMSKVIFQGFISSAQCLVLFLVIVIAGNYFHPPEFDEEIFQENLIERENPYIVDNSREVPPDTFVPVDDPMDSDDMDSMSDDYSEEETIAEEEEPSVANSGSIAWFAKTFYLKENILDSGTVGLSLEDGSPIMGDDQVQKTIKGSSIGGVIGQSLSLRLGAFLLATFVGVCMGLTVSSIVRSTTQAVMWVPLLLIPQILLGGFVITLPEMTKSVRSVASIIPSFSAQRMVDVSHVYGRMLPSVSNRTKSPLFLTSDGSKETVTWDEAGNETTQDYQQVSDVNTSWQNLAIHNEMIGEHKQAYNIAYGTDIQILTDTVDHRRDVKYSKGTQYKFLGPAYSAINNLLVWIVLSYLIIFVSLWKKKS
ncbi:MAG: ATP-binding cassette domain-containing protein [Akkermansiaceae bacterium]